MNAVDDDGQSFEQKHVHEVYEQIATHFSSTRFKPWPVVEEFLDSLPAGSVGVDIGCGNGKYLPVNRNVYIIASDRSSNLVSIARKHQPHEALVADGLTLPHTGGAFDFALSIAVVHHFSTRERRVCAIRQLLDVLRAPASCRSDGRQGGAGGKALIFVWALEQKNSRRGWDAGGDQDVMVPWVLKGENAPRTAREDRAGGSCELDSSQSRQKTFQRYYHLYAKGELELDIQHAGGTVLEQGYDRDNWWVVAARN